jgi:exo-beta-1,3-glucanase (GH17 family)
MEKSSSSVKTGWPNPGSSHGGFEPSPENALTYFINTCLWADEEDLDIIYSSSF